VAQGGRLVFEEWDFETDIWRVAPGAPATQLVTSTWRDLHPHASSDGRLAFASDRTGAWEIWTANADGTRPARLTRLGGPAALHPRWSPQGRRIAFEVRDAGHATVVVVDAEGGIPRAVTPGMDAIVPRWSRDGRALYVSSRRTGRWEIWRVPLSDGPPVQLTNAGGYAAEELEDGRIVYSKYGDRGLYVRGLAGGPERLIYRSLSPVDGTNWWTEDGNLVVPVRDADGVHLIHLDARTGGTTRIPGSIDALGGGDATLAPLPGGGVAYTRTMRVEADLVVAEPFEGR
jgi:dipeptidyl aminopeptidase/acylaminoacyl peptidase